MKKRNAFDQTMDEWNAVGGYYDELTFRNHLYYEASLTSGIADDLEAFKRLLDHCFCKIKSRLTKTHIKQLYYYKEGDPKNVVDWFDSEVKKIEEINTRMMQYRMDGDNLPTYLMEEQSKAKKRLRELHRELMLIMQLLGSFEKERKIRRPTDLFKDGDLFEEEDEVAM